MWKGCERTVFGLPELGFRWCLAFSHPLPMSFIESLQLWALSGIFLTTVLLSQPFLSVVARFDAGRLLFDDPTCSGTCLSIWPLVRAFYSAARVSRLNLLATFGATSCLRHSLGDVRALFVAAVLKGWSQNLLVFESCAVCGRFATVGRSQLENSCP